MYNIRNNSRNFASFGVTVTALCLLLSVPVLTKAEGNMKSLYERLGGYEAISAVANDFAEKLFIDPEVGSFFKGMGTDTRKSFIQKNINLICNVTGGPCKIISRNAKTVHAGLGITRRLQPCCKPPGGYPGQVQGACQGEGGAARDHRQAQARHR